jgi:acetyl esterase/lipase
MTYAFDPEIAAAIPMIPDTGDHKDVAAARKATKDMLAQLGGRPDSTGVTVYDELVPGPEGAPDVKVRVCVPDRRAAPAAIFDVHGGGFMIGDIDLDHRRNRGRRAACGARAAGP